MLTHSQGNKGNGQHTIRSSGRLWHRLAGCSGKQGRAVGVSTHTTAQIDDKQEERGDIVTELAFSTNSNVDSAVIEPTIVDLYTVGANVNEKGKNNTRPFIHQIQIQGLQGEVVRVWATFDEGALMEAMSTETFEKAKHRMGALAPSSLLLRMVNGTIVRSLGRC